jgi:predicted nucleic acid-binding Zn ribbon protein
MSAEVLRNCPKCGKDSLQRLIGTGAALVFKGSGFYETDYKNTSKTSDSSKEKPSESKPKKATEVKATASSNNA